MRKMSHDLKILKGNFSEIDAEELIEAQIEQEDKEELEMIQELSWISPECSVQNENNVVCHRCYYINQELLDKAEDDEIQIENLKKLTELLQNIVICPICVTKNYPVSPYCEKCNHIYDESQKLETQAKLKEGLRYCVHCNTFVEVEYFWCEECGFPLKMENLQSLAVCPECKSLYIQHASCRNCGFD